MTNKRITELLNNIKRLKENPKEIGFNQGWNACLDTIILDFKDEKAYLDPVE